MMVYAESCLAWIKDSPRLLEHGRRELEAMIRRDRNHPSVVIWGVLNENRPATALAADDLTRFVRGLDPTRVIVDNSGGSMAIDQDFGWVDRATAIADRQTERRKIMDIHIYTGAPAPAPVHEWLRTLGVGEQRVDMLGLGIGLPAVLEEFYPRAALLSRSASSSLRLGCGGMSDLRDTVARFGEHDGVDAHELRLFCTSLENGFRERRLERVFGSLDNLFAAAQEQQSSGNIRQIEAIMANPRTSGYCLTQLNDLSWEFHAGILDVWRRPKRVYEALKRVNRPRCLILMAASRVAACNSQTPMIVTLVDDIPVAEPATVHVTVADETGAQRASFRLNVPAGAGIKELGTVIVETGDRPGSMHVMARLDDGAKNLMVESTETIVVLAQTDAAAARQQVDWLDEPADAAPAQHHPDDTILGVARPGALPDHAWQALLSAVAAGSVAIIGPLAAGGSDGHCRLAGRGVHLQVHMGIGSWMGCYHWMLPSPLFAGLPATGLAGEPYTGVIPRYVLSEQGGEVLAGSLYNTNSRFQPPAMLWFSDVEAVPHGKGMLLFCQYRVFEQEASDPLAARLLANLVQVAQAYKVSLQHKRRRRGSRLRCRAFSYFLQGGHRWKQTASTGFTTTSARCSSPLSRRNGPSSAGRSSTPRSGSTALEGAQARCVQIFAKDHYGYCYFTCSLGRPYPTDVIGQLIAEARRRGMRVIPYYSVGFDAYATGTHPEWLYVDSPGRATVDANRPIPVGLP